MSFAFRYRKKAFDIERLRTLVRTGRFLKMESKPEKGNILL